MSEVNLEPIRCPICEQEHDLDYNERELCRCGTEFYTVLIGKENFDTDILNNLDIDIKKNKAAALFSMEYSEDEKSLVMVFVLGKEKILRAEAFENQSHLLVSKDEIKDEFIVLNLTG